ncbi:MAG: hypothetical protein JO115_10155 [Pseudonocardiales bacterium]|nr:hypothetical protein [Pseudonocardiales bacterium]
MAHYSRLPVELLRFATTERAELHTAAWFAVATPVIRERLPNYPTMLTMDTAGDPLIDEPTLLKALLKARHWQKRDTFAREWDKVAKTIDSRLVGICPAHAQFYRWLKGSVRHTPHPDACRILEAMFPGWTVQQLFQPVRTSRSRLLRTPTAKPDPNDDIATVTQRPPEPGGRRGGGNLASRETPGTPEAGRRPDREKQVIAMSAQRARDFLTRIEVSNVGAETLDQLADDLRRLVVAYLQQPLPTLLGDLVNTQNRAFELLEGHQKPTQTRDLYLVAGITCGLLAMASRDFGAAHEAMTQARTGYACADNAGHDGLRTWIRGLQANITYWSGRWEDSVRYAQLGAEAAARSRSTAAVLLASSEARALGGLHRLEEAHVALARAAEAQDRVQPDDLDVLGGLCTFTRPTQLKYAAETLSWGGAPEAGDAERFALEALAAFPTAIPGGGSFRNETTTRCILTVARVVRGEVEGAAEALGPVLALPPAQRSHTILTSVARVQTALSARTDPGREATALTGALEAFAVERLTPPR